MVAVQWVIRQGALPEEVVEGFQLVQDLPCSIDLVEQGHAGGANIMKDHSYSSQTLAARMSMQQVRPLTTPSDVDRKIARLEERIAQLGACQPNRITGRHAYQADLMAQVAPSGKGDPLETRAKSEEVMRMHTELYKGLSPDEVHYYDRRGEKLKTDRIKVNREKTEALETTKRTLKKDEEARTESEGVKNHIACVKFDRDEMAKLSKDLESPAISTMKLRDAGDLCAAPAEPEDTEKDVLEGLEKAHAPPQKETKWWVDRIAANRDLWSRVAVHTDSFGHGIWYLILLARQDGYQVTFLELRRRPRRLSVGGAASSSDLLPAYRMEFVCLPRLVFHHSEDVTIAADADLSVLPGVRIGGGCFYSNCDSEPFEFFTARYAPRLNLRSGLQLYMYFGIDPSELGGNSCLSPV